MRIGVFGGTFNPPHNGHVTMARAAAAQLGLDKLLLVPDSVPPHKPLPSGVTARQRYPWNGKVDIVVTFSGASNDVREDARRQSVLREDSYSSTARAMRPVTSFRAALAPTRTAW